MKKSKYYFGNIFTQVPMGVAIGILVVLTVFATFIVIGSAIYVPTHLDLIQKKSIHSILEIIGFVCTPLIGSVSTLLIYFSFIKQAEANKIQWKAIKKENQQIILDNSYERIKDLITDLKELLNGFSYQQKIPEILQDLSTINQADYCHKGMMGFNAVYKNLSTNRNKFNEECINHLDIDRDIETIYILFDSIVTELNNYKGKNKNLLFIKLKFVYNKYDIVLSDINRIILSFEDEQEPLYFIRFLADTFENSVNKYKIMELGYSNLNFSIMK